MAGEPLADDAAAMAGGSHQVNDGVSSSCLVTSLPALAHAGEQTIEQIAENSIASTHADGNTDSCAIPGAIEDKAPNGVVDKFESSFVPEVGMAFKSEKEALMMYNAYAGNVGFSIRKHDVKRRADGSIYQKHIVCSSQGYRKNESSNKAITRTGCNARIQFSVSKEDVWTVQKVVLDHNHYLASPDKRQKLKSQRNVEEADKQLIGQMREGGMKPGQIFEFMVQFYGGVHKVPFSKMDCNNEIGRQRKQYLEANDAQTLMEYLKNKQIEDPAFFYAVEIDPDDGTMANFFWADGTMAKICKKRVLY